MAKKHCTLCCSFAFFICAMNTFETVREIWFFIPHQRSTKCAILLLSDIAYPGRSVVSWEFAVSKVYQLA